MSKRDELRTVSRHLPEDDPAWEIVKYLQGEFFQATRQHADSPVSTHVWAMSPDWLQYLRDTLGDKWETETLMGCKVHVAESAGVPELKPSAESVADPELLARVKSALLSFDWDDWGYGDTVGTDLREDKWEFLQELATHVFAWIDED